MYAADFGSGDSGLEEEWVVEGWVVLLADFSVLDLRADRMDG